MGVNHNQIVLMGVLMGVNHNKIVLMGVLMGVNHNHIVDADPVNLMSITEINIL